AELRAAQSELRVFAHTDGLTGVSNARQFLVTAERVMRQSLANRTPMALVILDVDYFKEINDNYGHYTGDAVLKRIVTACEAVLRKSDLIARMGGDEFAVLLPNTGTEQAALVIKRLTAAVAQLSLVEFGVSGHLSISAGSAILADDDTDINALMRRADRAMYRVKVLTHRSRAA
ncbi:MAG TPA: GGDEF domain-containing protein, partial [Anaerolineae bacterium]